MLLVFSKNFFVEWLRSASTEVGLCFVPSLWRFVQFLWHQLRSCLFSNVFSLNNLMDLVRHFVDFLSDFLAFKRSLAYLAFPCDEARRVRWTGYK